MTARDGSLTALEQADAFVGRHIGPRDEDVAVMLEAVGYESLDALMDAAVPASIRAEIPADFPESRTERDVLTELAALAGNNRVARSMIGLGYHDTITPPVIQRNILENPGWYTAYTPYQPEISLGRLEALLNFQTMVMDLTGLSCGQCLAARRGHGGGRGHAHEPRHRQEWQRPLLRLRRLLAADHRGGADPRRGHWHRGRGGPITGPGCRKSRSSASCCSTPEVGGAVPDYTGIVEQAHAQGAVVTVAADLLSLVLLTPPGEFGADIAVGNTQRFGVPLGYGGPHAAYFATHEKFRRAMPGRIVGVSVDSRGRQALRLALQTREQHIRREKATSNICTAQVLLGVIAGMYAVYHGQEGLTRIARRVHRLTDILAAGLARLGFAIESENWFDTLTVCAPGAAKTILKRAEAAGYNLRPIDDDRLGIACDETTTRADIEAVWRAFADGEPGVDVAVLDGEARCGLPEGLARQTAFLEHPVFNLYHAETELLRYMRRLEGRDLTLNQAMIPLGSCTMKLNATAEMMPITWPGFGDIHPFAPAAQAAGYRELVSGLERMLSQVTGFAAVSLQPNAGSQGEYAGLLVIRRYHESRGEGGRDVCLIPSSAHGTNPASAVMAGMPVQVVACDEDGNVDLADLRAKAEAPRRRSGGANDHLSPRRMACSRNPSSKSAR